MTAPVRMRAGRTLSEESPITGGVVTLYMVTPEGQPDVAIGSVMNVELADAIVGAVNARASAAGALLSFADDLDVSFAEARNEYAKDAWWLAAKMARAKAQNLAAATTEPVPGSPVTGEDDGHSVDPDRPEALGRLVREVWTAWADEQDHPKLSWLVGWEQLDAGQREVDARIGLAVAAAERERIARLAEERGATCWDPDGRHVRRPFADFIRSLP